jgi:hypothetical protein
MSLGLPPLDCLEKCQKAFGKDSPSRSSIYSLYKYFQAGNTDLADTSPPGRTKDDELSKSIHESLDEHPYLSTYALAELHNVARQTISRYLREELGMIKVNMKWVPHVLSDENKAKRVQLSKEMLKVLKSSEKIGFTDILTGDESWVYYSSPFTSMWMYSEMEREEIPKRTIDKKKIMITVFWGVFGFQIVDQL